MVFFNGKYYLQYAAPGTELATYGDGVYVGDTPMGPFTYQAHNPFSARPAGFITAAGHGSTIKDEHGNLWHASTMRVSVNQSFERRLGLFPAGVDEDGILYCNQNFADYPYHIPEGKFDARSLKPAWMLLSYKKAGTASSSTAGHGSELALNEDIRSCWCASGCQGEWYSLDLGEAYTVHALQINFADVDVPMKKVDKSLCSDMVTSNRYIDSDHTLKTEFLLEGRLDGNNWFALADKRGTGDDLAHEFLKFDGGVLVQHIKISEVQLPYNKKFALSGLRVFGVGLEDGMTAKISWSKAPDAIGYNIRFGISPNKLYTSYQIYEDTEVLPTVLNKGQSYYISVDSFNENGITDGTTAEMQG